MSTKRIVHNNLFGMFAFQFELSGQYMLNKNQKLTVIFEFGSFNHPRTCSVAKKVVILAETHGIWFNLIKLLFHWMLQFPLGKGKTHRKHQQKSSIDFIEAVYQW